MTIKKPHNNKFNMDDEVKQIIAKRFKEVPKVVQNAILSSNVEENLRSLSEKHRLHFDQWVTLENEIMMTLLGIQTIDKLGENISEEAEVPLAVGEAIALDASKLIFEPIRKELERELDHPSATTEKDSPDITPPTSIKTKPSTERASIVGDPYRESIT